MKIKCKKGDCPNEVINFDGCCWLCPDREECNEESKCTDNPDDCGEAIFEGTELEIFQNTAAAIITKISSIVTQKKQLESAEAEMKEQLQAAMEKHGIKKFDNDVIKVTYVEPSTRSSVDGVKLRAELPDIAAKYTKTSNVKGYVKIEVKG